MTRRINVCGSGGSTRNRNDEDVILRDLFGKMAKWVNKFKEVGDVAVQYDPVHAALPWTGVRFLLQVGSFNGALHKLNYLHHQRSQ